ncbi:hypothetical protein AB0I51_11350 [Streptomyces sp. NPDC050549]|uniref:hypothetical protein n=1 Tax=Streptomyces sp. NPDC050549 TaxID=3155406 RepID=UPI0034298738
MGQSPSTHGASCGHAPPNSGAASGKSRVRAPLAEVQLRPVGEVEQGAYYGARSACEPLHVQADPEGQVIAVNHTRAGLRNAVVSTQLLDLSGRRLGANRRARLEVAPAAIAKAFSVPWTDGLPDLHLLRLTLEDGDGRLRSRNTYWRYRTPAAMRALGEAPRTKVSASVGRVSRSGLTATVRNDGPAVAAMVRLSLTNGTTGDRMLPTLYSHNYLWLLPGESQTVTLSWPARALASGHPLLTAEAYNSRPSTAR